MPQPYTGHTQSTLVNWNADAHRFSSLQVEKSCNLCAMLLNMNKIEAKQPCQVSNTKAIKEQVLPYYSRTYVNVFSVRDRARIRVGVMARVRVRVRARVRVRVKVRVGVRVSLIKLQLC